MNKTRVVQRQFAIGRRWVVQIQFPRDLPGRCWPEGSVVGPQSTKTWRRFPPAPTYFPDPRGRAILPEMLGQVTVARWAHGADHYRW